MFTVYLLRNSQKDTLYKQGKIDVHPARITSDGYSYEADYQKQQKSLFANMNVEYYPMLVNGSDFKVQYIEALKIIRDKRI